MDSSNQLRRSPVVFFDGVCNLCNHTVQFLIRRDRRAVLKFASLQSEVAERLLAPFQSGQTLPDSIVFLDEGRLYVESDAVLRICRYLGQPWKSLYYFRFLPAWLRNGIYRLVANNRYAWFGRKDQCMIPGPGIQERFL